MLARRRPHHAALAVAALTLAAANLPAPAATARGQLVAEVTRIDNFNATALDGSVVPWSPAAPHLPGTTLTATFTFDTTAPDTNPDTADAYFPFTAPGSFHLALAIGSYTFTATTPPHAWLAIRDVPPFVTTQPNDYYTLGTDALTPNPLGITSAGFTLNGTARLFGSPAPPFPLPTLTAAPDLTQLEGNGLGLYSPDYTNTTGAQAGFALLASIHSLTLTVPEPSAIALSSLPLAGLLFHRPKPKRRPPCDSNPLG